MKHATDIHLQFWIFDLNNATSSNTTAIKTLRILKRSILLKTFFLKNKFIILQVLNFDHKELIIEVISII